MSNKKKATPAPQDFEKLLKMLEQMPKAPEQSEQELPAYSPWNVSMKRPGVKRTIAYSLTEEQE